MNVATLLEDNFEGQTLANAIEHALARFDCGRSDIETEILQAPTCGFLGIFGRRPARIRVRLTSRLLAAQKITAQLVFLTGFQADVRGMQRGDRLLVNLDSPASALLIGRHGQGIDALQHLVNLLLDQVLGRGVRVEIDCDGYRFRRAESLNQVARSLVSRVRKTGQPVTSPALDRESCQHLNRLLERENGMRTRVVGQGPEQKLVVFDRAR